MSNPSSTPPEWKLPPVGNPETLAMIFPWIAVFLNLSEDGQQFIPQAVVDQAMEMIQNKRLRLEIEEAELGGVKGWNLSLGLKADPLAGFEIVR